MLLDFIAFPGLKSETLRLGSGAPAMRRMMKLCLGLCI